MNCEKFQEIIITDYLDGQMNKTDEGLLKEHLAHCNTCREFETRARKMIIDPFDKLSPAKPPAFLWEQIKKAIEPREKKSIFNPFSEGLLRLLNLERSIFALSSVCAVLLIAFVMIRAPHFLKNLENQQLAQSYLEEEIQSFSSYGSEQTDDLNTDIETYLL